MNNNITIIVLRFVLHQCCHSNNNNIMRLTTVIIIILRDTGTYLLQDRTTAQADSYMFSYICVRTYVHRSHRNKIKKKTVFEIFVFCFF